MVEIINITEGACQFEDNGVKFVLNRLEKKIVSDEFPNIYRGLVLITRRIEEESQKPTVIEVKDIKDVDEETITDSTVVVQKMYKSKQGSHKWNYQFSNDNGETWITVENNFKQWCMDNDLRPYQVKYNFQVYQKEENLTRYKGWLIRRSLKEEYKMRELKKRMEKEKLQENKVQ